VLDPRLIALQGLGFTLTPIAIAVQGLIEQIQEEARDDDTTGGGRRRGGRLAWLFGAPAVRTRQQPGKVGADVTEAEVRAQWELLEARQAAQAKKPAAKAEVPQPLAQPLAPPITAQRAEPDLVAALEADDDEALALILAQL
jgi:hypothetical protein